jgi:hypothetical protein
VYCAGTYYAARSRLDSRRRDGPGKTIAVGRLAPDEIARLLALSAAATRLEVPERLARRDASRRWPMGDLE